MKIDRSLLRKKGVLLTYLTSYCGLVLLVCAAFSVVLFTLTATELEKISMDEIGKRTQAVATDLDRQYRIMQDIAYETSYEYQYKPAYLKQNKYHEVELLKELEKYDGYSPLFEEFYLFYAGEDMVYRAIGQSKVRASILMWSEIGISDAAEAELIYSEISSLEKARVVVTQGDLLLFCYPVRLKDDSETRATLCFRVSVAQLAKRIAEIGSIGRDELTVCWGEQLLMAGSDSDQPIYTCFSEEGFEIRVCSDGIHGRIGSWQRTLYLVLAVLSMLFFALAVVAAVHNYRPLYDLTVQFGGFLREGEDEYSSLQRIVRQSIENSQVSQKKLAENMKWLNRQRVQSLEQVLLLAMSGNLPVALRNELQEYRLLDEDRYFVVVCVRPEKAMMTEEIQGQIAALSDGGKEFFAVRLPSKNVFAVVISSVGEDDVPEAVALMRELFEALAIVAQISSSAVCTDIECLPDSFVMAMDGLDYGATEVGLGMGEEKVGRLLGIIQTGDRLQTEITVREMLNSFSNEKISMLYRCYAMSDMVNSMIRMATSSEIDVPKEHLGVVLQYGQPAVVQQRILHLADELCRRFGERNNAQDQALQDRIVNYVHDHVTDYELCLTRAAAENGIGTKRLEQVIRQKTGYTFHEYVIRQRMEVAKNLIAQGRSVAETGNTVCYNSTSYFIRTFKQYTGMTPTEYRKWVEQQR